MRLLLINSLFSFSNKQEYLKIQRKRQQYQFLRCQVTEEVKINGGGGERN